MYLQITTKCNMRCPHCCYSCTMQGQHMTRDTLVDAVSFAHDYSDIITIGGGEPTLHPDFWFLIEICLKDFDYVWMATNGSQTKTMFRLADIIDGCDLPDQDFDCECETEDPERYAEDGCWCWERHDYDSGIYQEDKLSVALSQDCHHDPIDQQVVDLWNRRANMHGPSYFEIRDVTRSNSGVIAQGRAALTGSGWNTEDCVCSDIIIKPSGKLKLCGCDTAPVIGDIRNGIAERWEKVLNDDLFREAECWKAYKAKKDEAEGAENDDSVAA